MAKVGLGTKVDATFINRLAGLARGNDTGKNLAASLRGGSQSAAQLIGSGLRLGARTYSAAVQGINLGISTVNVASADLTRIDKILDKMLLKADRATQASTNSQERRNLNAEFRVLVRDFRNITESAELAGREYLTLDGLAETFTLVGLSPEDAPDIEKTLDELYVEGGKKELISEKTRAKGPINVPPGVRLPTQDTSQVGDLFSTENGIDKRAGAYRMKAHLEEMKRQVKVNLETLDDVRNVLGKNLDLVRVTGLAMLEVSEEITGADEANDVARKLRNAIRKDAGAALSQAANLEPMLVAALTLDSKDFEQ